MSAQQRGVVGLKEWNPGRYGALNVNGAGQAPLSWDIYSQVAQAVKHPAGIKLLGDLKVRNVIATGHSSAATQLRIYYNSIHPTAGVIDGFVLHGVGNALIRTDITTPAWRLLSELEVARQNGSRQSDTDYLRTWEVAGAAHAGWDIIRFGSMDVFVMNTAGGDPLRVTEGAGDEVSPRWSPDNRFLAYAADPPNGTRIYLVPPLRGAERELAETGLPSLERFFDTLSVLGAMPWSRDSKELVFARATESGGTAIFRKHIETGKEMQVTFPGPGESDSSAAWSFDGTQIVFDRTQGGGRRIWAVPAAGGEAAPVADTAWGGVAWSADSKRLVHVGRGGNLWEVTLGSDRGRRLDNSPVTDLWPAISAGGRLAYATYRHQVDLFAHDVETRKDTRLTDNTGGYTNFSRVSPLAGGSWCINPTAPATTRYGCWIWTHRERNGN